MNIPNVPTDNLYKFFSIFGIILLIGSIYLYQVSDKDIHNARIRSELSEQNRVFDSLEMVHKAQLLDYRSEIMKDLNNSPDKINSYDHYSEMIAELNQSFEDYFVAKDNFIKSVNTGYKNNGDLIFYESEQDIYNLYAIRLAIFGILFIGWGFASWYFKHQIYVDAEIKWKGEIFRQLLKEAKEAKEIDKKKNASTDSKEDVPH